MSMTDGVDRRSVGSELSVDSRRMGARSDERRAELLKILRGAERTVIGSELASTLGVSRQAIVTDVAILRAAGERVVTDDVMRRMSAKLKPPTFEEGFSKITVVRVKRKSE